jgi:hypothetical protein
MRGLRVGRPLHQPQRIQPRYHRRLQRFIDPHTLYVRFEAVDQLLGFGHGFGNSKSASAAWRAALQSVVAPSWARNSSSVFVIRRGCSGMGALPHAARSRLDTISRASAARFRSIFLSGSPPYEPWSVAERAISIRQCKKATGLGWLIGKFWRRLSSESRNERWYDCWLVLVVRGLPLVLR